MAGSQPQTSRYLVHGRLAAGGMGEVYLGTQVSPAGRRRVAIKRLADSRKLDPAAMSRLVAEARLGFQLTHANICQVVDLVVSEESTYIVMEFVRGLDLRALLRRLEATERPLEPAFALYIAREVARALDYTHRRIGDDRRPLFLVHGDVTPPNVLLSIEGEVKLADFGIARALDGSAPGTSVRGGTVGYMAPEVAGGAVDHRADVFSLGATLAEALSLSPAPPAEASAIAERACAADVRERYLSAADMERALALELARRAPGFTPSALGALVQACLSRPAGAPAGEGDEEKTLFELESRVWPAGAPDRDADPRPTRPGERRETRTVTGGVRRRRALAASLALVALAGAAALAAPVMRARSAADADADRALRAVSPGPAASRADRTAARAGAGDDGGARDAQATGRDPRAAAASAAPAPSSSPAPAPARPRRARRAARAQTAYVTVNASPWGAVYIDGVRVASETPLYRHPVAPGAHRVAVFYPDRGEFSPVRTMHLSPDQHATVGFTR
jgi:serine/threonine-protein kinase